MSESDAVESLERLGLTSYEAKVFIALQKLGAGTARDVHRITDVPRSQVYSVAENLADRGLIEVQQSSPIQYRPVGIDEARETLRSRFEREQEQAFDYVEDVRDQHDDGAEEQEAIWTLRGSERVEERAIELIREADERVVFGSGDQSLISDEIERTLRERVDDGLVVAVVSENPDVRAYFESVDGVHVADPPVHHGEESPAGRVVFVDGDTLLLSVVGDDSVPGGDRETAIWSAESNFARMLIQIVEANLGV
ncbi:Sugar-specific transcriptional regulator TrmB [Natronoarchaeum philippinense]|uniref:Sugar-specific transcriptional regulator TrmB n=1 Tax=Natronoarchaeum philippinense TaxID=558529 RepID=A0A285NAP7_NATPI|nr:helix-turn-helix domain-containing protein [Natronoarchaeum philippinense]SNZ05983.1 Sugar-specific transcriptional regulator TrmB [Natronoarchaeum philippinense]